jgi:hypothetical protein
MIKLTYLLFFVLSIFSNITFCQLLDNSKGNALSDRPFFNEDLIRENKIKSLSVACLMS